jgi:hypothetical protein
MLCEHVNGPSAWTAGSLDNQQAWLFRLPGDMQAALDRSVKELGSAPLTSLDAAHFPCWKLRDCLKPAMNALERGRGFVILDGIPRERYSVQEMQAIYWLTGGMLGRPATQNIQGTLLYDVRDTGQALSEGARFSVTSYESSFHTDNSFGDKVVDYVGLLCLNSARAGGLSQVVSGYAVHNRLLAEHADLLPVLYRPFHVDRRGGVRPGEGPTVAFPVLQWDGTGLTFRYLRLWIHSGHDKAAQPLTSEQVRALDALDSTARDPSLRAEFMLRPGQMFFINNRWILHNRTAFEDYHEPERKRHYVRLWLERVQQ